jgi:uncharacterized protein YxjI
LSNGWRVEGNASCTKYIIYDKTGKEIATIKQKIISFGNTYRLEFDKSDNELYLLMIALAVDMYHAPSKAQKIKDSMLLG